MTIEEYLGDWTKVIDLNETNKILRQLSSVHICPQRKDIFRAFHLCPLNSLRVCIIGQDPYPNMRMLPSKEKVPVATGIAFANTADTPEALYSPSLEVLRESVIDYSKPHRLITFDPSLEKWESQGVLLLNSALTCEVGRVDSHALLWWPFMKSLLKSLSTYHTGVVYVLMGTQAQNLEPFINKEQNHILHIRHPSWYARTKTSMPSDIWTEINSILIGQNGYGIEWYKEY